LVYFRCDIDEHLMKSRTGIVFLLVASILVLSGKTPEPKQKRLAHRIHRHALVIDTHTDTPLNLAEAYFDMAVRHHPPASRVDIPRLKEGGVDGVFFALFTGQKPRTEENYNAAYVLANRLRDSTLAAIGRNSQAIGLATSPNELIALAEAGKTAICLGMENGFPLAKDKGRVEEFYNKGVRYITLCHSTNNDICDSSTDPKGPEHNGLSSFGREVVTEMNRLGMIVDVSHISDKAFFDVIEASAAPVIASHSSVRALCNHPRNLTDEMILALARKGGVIQICILGAYIEKEDTTTQNYIQLEKLRQKYRHWQFRSESERKQAWRSWDSIMVVHPPVLPTVARAVDHIDHVVNLVGIDHVGIGSDFDGGGALADCPDVAAFPAITAELLTRGYSAGDIEKIWGGNFIRVWKAVENAGKENTAGTARLP